MFTHDAHAFLGSWGRLHPLLDVVNVWGVDLAGEVIAVSDIHSGLWLIRLEERD